jgi:hypothetical protein
MKICFHVEVDGSAGIWALAANRFGVKEMAMIDWYKRSSESIINHTNVIIKRYTQVDDFFDSEPLGQKVILDVNADQVIDEIEIQNDAWICVGPNGGWHHKTVWPENSVKVRLPVSRDLYSQQAFCYAFGYLNGLMKMR